LSFYINYLLSNLILIQVKAGPEMALPLLFLISRKRVKDVIKNKNSKTVYSLKDEDYKKNYKGNDY